MRRSVCLSLVLLLLTSCTPPPKAAPTARPFPTSIPATPTPTPFAFVSSGTPVPVAEVAISSDNLNSLTRLARWGNGRVVQVAVDPAGQRLAIAVPLGIHLFNAATFAPENFIEVEHG